jgi:hypothetical protein
VLLAAHADGDRLITDERYDERAAVEASGLPVVLSRDPSGWRSNTHRPAAGSATAARAATAAATAAAWQ